MLIDELSPLFGSRCRRWTWIELMVSPAGTSGCWSTGIPSELADQSKSMNSVVSSVLPFPPPPGPGSVATLLSIGDVVGSEYTGGGECCGSKQVAGLPFGYAAHVVPALFTYCVFFTLL